MIRVEVKAGGREERGVKREEGMGREHMEEMREGREQQEG